MGAILIGDSGILQKRYPLTHRFANVEVIEVADKDDVAFGETGIVRALGQFIAVYAALVKPDPAGQVVLPIRLYLYIKDSALFIFQIYIETDAMVLIAVTHFFLAVKKFDPLNGHIQQRLQKQTAYFLRTHNLPKHKI